MRNTSLKSGRSFWLALTFLFGFIGAAFAADPLVDAAWVKANLGKPGVVVVSIDSASDFLRGHIPGAANTDFGKSGWREENAEKVPGMLPAKLDKLIAHVGSLGIDNNTHVVLVAPGGSYSDMGWATRIYWTLKVLGHDNLSILNGGMEAWTKDKTNPLETGASKVAAKTFTAHPRLDMVASAADVKAAKAKGVLLVDNRPEDQYVGINGSPAAKENGTIPGAHNLPSGWTTENGGGMFRPRTELEKLFKVASVPTSGEQINFCNTGHWASVGWFVSSEIMGNKKARIYDGSMTEWTITKAGPVEHKISLK